ncbi:MAG: pyrroline-5-carboxylate reductase dimerization domain-containing protein [Solirubrobacterales bacterium]
MKIGFIGSGNMARAIALGLGQPGMFSDSGSGRADKLAQLTGGTAADPEEVAGSAEILFLCHKPAQMAEIATRIGHFDGVVVSVLAATSLSSLRHAYPVATIVRAMPNTPVELNAGVICVAGESDASPECDVMLERLGRVVRLPESQLDLATAIGGCAPAFFALFAGLLLEQATVRGMDPEIARVIVGGTLAGTASLLDANAMDTAATIAAVASPGGLTERALASFDQSGLNGAIGRAVATVLGEPT